jgi:hypothetical protein
MESGYSVCGRGREQQGSISGNGKIKECPKGWMKRNKKEVNRGRKQSKKESKNN